jgi:hypothetical protein
MMFDMSTVSEAVHTTHSLTALHNQFFFQTYAQALNGGFGGEQ